MGVRVRGRNRVRFEVRVGVKVLRHLHLVGARPGLVVLGLLLAAPRVELRRDDVDVLALDPVLDELLAHLAQSHAGRRRVARRHHHHEACLLALAVRRLELVEQLLAAAGHLDVEADALVAGVLDVGALLAHLLDRVRREHALLARAAQAEVLRALELEAVRLAQRGGDVVPAGEGDANVGVALADGGHAPGRGVVANDAVLGTRTLARGEERAGLTVAGGLLLGRHAGEVGGARPEARQHAPGERLRNRGRHGARDAATLFWARVLCLVVAHVVAHLRLHLDRSADAAQERLRRGARRQLGRRELGRGPEGEHGSSESEHGGAVGGPRNTEFGSCSCCWVAASPPPNALPVCQYVLFVSTRTRVTRCCGGDIISRATCFSGGLCRSYVHHVAGIEARRLRVVVVVARVGAR